MYVINPGESCKCEAVANEAGLKGERLFHVFSLFFGLLVSDETLVHYTKKIFSSPLFFSSHLLQHIIEFQSGCGI